MIKKELAEVWAEYEKAISYDTKIGLFRDVQNAEDFYVGDQWKGLNAPDMDKPVVNILRRPVSYLVASLMSEDIGIGLSMGEDSQANKALTDMLKDQIDMIMEQVAIKKKFRGMLRNACIDGDGCIHFAFDTEAMKKEGETGGMIRAELLENTCVYFGNTESCEVQEQPWIMLRYRMDTQELKEEYPKREDLIVGDEEPNATNPEYETGKTTVLRKYWKHGGTVRYLEMTKTVMLRGETETGLREYPLVWMPWDQVKNRYHGKSVITAMIPNQIYRNKLMAMAMRHVYMMGFPKVIYDRTRLPQGWTNRVGEAISCNGNPNEVVATAFKAPDMSEQVLRLIATIKDETTEAVGASDAALGNVKPDNTSAIIATQKATAVPLELQRMAFYDAVEETVRIWVEMMRCYYGVRNVKMTVTDEQTGQSASRQMLYDFASLDRIDIKLDVDVGATSYWSELTQTSTMDNLFRAGVIDTETYLKYLPDGVLKQRSALMEELKKKERREAETNGVQGVPMRDAGIQGGGIGQGDQGDLLLP